MSLDSAASFLLVVVVCLQHAHCHLDRYVNYFEPVEYDKDRLLNDHHRIRRTPITNAGNTEGNTLKLSFNAFGKSFDLSLQPDSEHNDYKLVVDGKPHSKHLANSLYYTGYDTSDPTGTYVHGSLAFGVFDGTIHGRDEVYYIEPSHRYFSNMSPHSIIYRQSDTKQYHHETEADVGWCRVKSSRTKRSESVSTQHNQVLPRQESSRDLKKVRCQLNVVIDHHFYEEVTDDTQSPRYREAQAIATVKNIIKSGSQNFQRTDFDGDGTPDNIHFGVSKISLVTNSSDYNEFKVNISNKFIGIESLIVDFSKTNFQGYCLSYLFTYRDFDEGVLGLAYIGTLNRRGGVCSESQNTGIVTLQNFGKRVSNSVAQLTFTHEAGHNFGAIHDPDKERPECRGSTSVNNHYVMFSKATTGQESNNDKFSDCSKGYIFPLLQKRAQLRDDDTAGCLKHADDNCGNFLIDSGEACDCGIDFNEITGLCHDDHCCNGSICQLNLIIECSPQQGPCCNSSCQFIPDITNTTCSEETECSLSQTCNGYSAFCPKADPIESPEGKTGILCNDNKNYCDDGECTGSICIPLQLDDCECTEDEYLCHICCRLANNTCASTYAIAEQNQTARLLLPNGEGNTLGVGFPCNNSYGYCDFFDSCRLVNSAGSIKRLTEIIEGNSIVQRTFNYLQRYWWAGVAGAAGILLMAFIVVAICHSILPRPKHIQKRMEKRAKIRKEKRRQKLHNR